jgi:hypothetical protein
MSCRERRAIDVYVHAASQPVRRRKLAKIFTTIFHLISSLRCEAHCHSGCVSQLFDLSSRALA